MKKIYVLDTNILLSDPLSIYAFEDNDVVVPSVVLQEMDKKKTAVGGIGFNARCFSNEIDQLREKGKLHKGVDLRSGGKLYVKSHPENSSAYDTFLDDSADTRIIALAQSLQLENDESMVIVVSRDTLVRVKADSCNIVAEDYKFDKVVSSDSDKFKGYRIIDTTPDVIDEFYVKKEVTLDDSDLEENEIVLMKFGKQSALGINKKGIIKPFYNYEDNLEYFGIQAKNVEQKMALELLLDKNVPLVTLTGRAGTGKTLLALAAGLHHTLDLQKYKKVSVARPNVQLGKEHGYLKGDLEEKLRPLTQPIYDNLEFLLDCKDEEELEEKMQGYENFIKVEAISYIRGRSIPKQFIIIDEAQNLTQHEVKTILTRVGENTKIVLVGDPEQIDHPYLDSYNNGLTYVIERLKHLKETAHVTLRSGERSALAELCADLL